MLENAQAVQAAGAHALLVEAVTPEVTAIVHDRKERVRATPAVRQVGSAALAPSGGGYNLNWSTVDGGGTFSETRQI